MRTSCFDEFSIGLCTCKGIVENIQLGKVAPTAYLGLYSPRSMGPRGQSACDTRIRRGC